MQIEVRETQPQAQPAATDTQQSVTTEMEEVNEGDDEVEVLIVDAAAPAQFSCSIPRLPVKSCNIRGCHTSHGLSYEVLNAIIFCHSAALKVLDNDASNIKIVQEWINDLQNLVDLPSRDNQSTDRCHDSEIIALIQRKRASICRDALARAHLQLSFVLETQPDRVPHLLLHILQEELLRVCSMPIDYDLCAHQRCQWSEVPKGVVIKRAKGSHVTSRSSRAPKPMSVPAQPSSNSAGDAQSSIDPKAPAADPAVSASAVPVASTLPNRLNPKKAPMDSSSGPAPPDSNPVKATHLIAAAGAPPKPAAPLVTAASKPMQSVSGPSLHAAPASKGMKTLSTSKKHDDFIRGPIGNKPVDLVAGIGPANAKFLAKKHITTAIQLLGQFLLMNKDVPRFVEWLRVNVPGMYANHRLACAHCLAQYCKNNM